MPVYDFRCSACEHTFDVTLPFGSKEKPPCPVCSSRKTAKQFTPPAIHFKGSGFFKTDSKVPAKDTETKQNTSDAKPKKTEEKNEQKPSPQSKKDPA